MSRYRILFSLVSLELCSPVFLHANIADSLQCRNGGQICHRAAAAVIAVLSVAGNDQQHDVCKERDTHQERQDAPGNETLLFLSQDDAHNAGNNRADAGQEITQQQQGHDSGGDHTALKGHRPYTQPLDEENRPDQAQHQQDDAENQQISTIIVQK